MKKIDFKIVALLISFKKFLLSYIIYFLFVIDGYRNFALLPQSKIKSFWVKGQSVLEYSLLLVVIASIVIAFFADGFKPLKGIFNSTHRKMMERIVNGV